MKLSGKKKTPIWVWFSVNMRKWKHGKQIVPLPMIYSTFMSPFFPSFTLSLSLAPSDHLFCHFLCLLFLFFIVTFTFFYLLKAFKLEQLLDTCTMNKNRAVFKQSKIHIHIIKLYGRAVFCAFNSCWRRFLLY